ncbi:MAG: ABC transporter permease, partial [Rhodoplanes sp.]
LELLGLGDRARNTPAQLSGGQQQRVAIARALINNPSVLLADEPTGNLDTRTSQDIMKTLRMLNRERGVTVVVVTHEADIAAYADRIITMRDGQIISDERRPVGAIAQAAAEPAAPSDSPPRPSLKQAAGGSFASLWALGLMILTAATQALARNKMRSSLTMLGVFIGVAALIAMMAVGKGANEAVRKQIESLGTNLLVVVPGAAVMGGMRGGLGSASTITVADAEAIRREAPAVASVSYVIRQAGQIQYANKNWTTGIMGVTANYPPTTNWRIVAGRGITHDDDLSAALVVVIGQTVSRQLFGANANPLGAVIQAKGVPLRVIGVLGSKGQTPFGTDQDDVIMVPFSTGERKVLGVAAPSQEQVPLNWAYPPAPNPYNFKQRMTGFVNQIYVQAASPAHVQPAIGQATEILMRRHRIRAGDANDFSVRNLSQIAETAETSSRIMALLLAAVASISLVVGGIGIMNILLVSVTERTREIGLRMAIGARRLHVLLQFLAEAVLLSVTGGVAGIVMGVALSKTLSLAAGWPTPIVPAAIVGGFLFAAAVGIFFGYYPARKAAGLDPIEALRYE